MLAGGVQLAASCDLVLAHEGASFCLPGVRSPGGFCHTPPCRARGWPHKALELALLGSEIGAAEAAGSAGQLSGRRLEWPTAVDRTADQLARTFSKSVADGKRTFYRQLVERSLRDRYALATDAMVGMFSSPAYQESMRTPGARREEGHDTGARRADILLHACMEMQRARARPPRVSPWLARTT